MPKDLEISYYNAFVLTGGPGPGEWHVEESRIKGDFNGVSTDYGARAYTTDNEYGVRRRPNAMMYSGVYNSKTKVNKTNEFSISESITRAVDIANGDIQHLHAEDTNLNIFQQHKVSRALIDKDAIFTAEGLGLTTTGNVVIGQIVPYSGKFGISDNPESFAFYGNRKYFVDRARGTVMRLSQNGLEPISRYGMTDFFRDNLAKTKIDLSSGNSEIGRIFGMYDERHGEYVISLQHSSLIGGKKTSATSPATSDQNGFLTLGFSEGSNGWVSLYSYKPRFGFSMLNEFYTFNYTDLYRHYDANAKYNNFYGTIFNDPSYVTLIMNDGASDVKAFTTINYEGSAGWSMDRAEAENVSREGYVYSSQKEEAYKIPKKGVTILDNRGIAVDVGFKLKESKYYADIRQKLPYASSNYNSTFNTNTFNTTLGIKGYHAEIDMLYHEPTGNGKKVELFAVSNEIKI
jgi:hypothetical protein